MKYKLIIAALLSITAFKAMGQCTPLPYKGNYIKITPDSAHFPHATLNQLFSATFNIQVAQDTFISQLGLFKIDSIHVDSVVIFNKPIGTIISFQCNTGNCTFLGATANCMKLSASSHLTEQIGTYKTKVYATARGSIDTFKNLKLPYTIAGYNVVVDSISTNGIENFSASKDYIIYPNPTNTNGICIFTAISGNYNLLEFSGKSLQKGYLNLGENKIELPPNISNGIYFIQIGNTPQKLIINQ